MNVGDLVQFHGRRLVYRLEEIHEDGTAYISKQTRTGQYLKMCNPIHVCDVKLFGSIVTPKDRNGKTAREAADIEGFQVGNKAIMTILGDLWVTVKEILPDGSIITENAGDFEKFRPHLHMGSWGWWTRDYYHLRASGAFNEYDN